MVGMAPFTSGNQLDIQITQALRFLDIITNAEHYAKLVGQLKDERERLLKLAGGVQRVQKADELQAKADQAMTEAANVRDSAQQAMEEAQKWANAARSEAEEQVKQLIADAHEHRRSLMGVLEQKVAEAEQRDNEAEARLAAAADKDKQAEKAKELAVQLQREWAAKVEKLREAVA
jgi:vacuolar-type H+-ATPase subunit D/Vma8